MPNAYRDENDVPTLIAVSSVDGQTPVRLYADPTTHRLLVDSSGGGGSGFTYAYEVPTGTINGDGQGSGNTAFTLAHTPTNPSGMLLLGYGGFASSWNYIYGIDFTVTGATINFVQAPLIGTNIYAFYS